MVAIAQEDARDVEMTQAQDVALEGGAVFPTQERRREKGMYGAVSNLKQYTLPSRR